MKSLNIIVDKLQTLKKKYSRKTLSYQVPTIWFDKSNSKVTVVNPFDFFLEKFEEIKNLDKVQTHHKRAYNLFIRYALNWNHKFQTEYKKFPKDAFSNKGTILKAITLLPYIHSLGCNIIHLLPITEIGKQNRKGNLGSPYAIKNPLKIEPTLDEPILEIDLDIQYKAFIEAAQSLGMKVIQEFIFRTASIDSDLAIDNPEWFYWIKGNTKLRQNSEGSGYGNPVYSKKKLLEIKEKFLKGDNKNTIHPDEKYRNYFTKTPIKTARVDDKITGLLSAHSPKKSEEVKIPQAFADWPPDDNQPSWDDVTYLKFYDNAKFNYIAYNTIRFYDKELKAEINKVNSLWDYTKNILPYWIDKFNIDGAMIDMGHALPEELLEEIISEVKSKKTDFIFWEENFNPDEKSERIGFDASLGYSIFDSANHLKYKELIEKLIRKENFVDFLLTPENHNTKRAIRKINNKNYSVLCYLLNSFLGNVNFIHSGFEILEKNPLNTGLGFTENEIKELTILDLGLFSDVQMDWTSGNIIEEIQMINKIRNVITDIQSIELLETDLIAIKILSNQNKYVILANLFEEDQTINLSGEVLFEIGKIEKTENQTKIGSISGCISKF